MSKRWKQILIGAGVLVLAVGGYFAYQFFSTRSALADVQASVQTEVVEMGTLSTSVDATGTVRAGQSATLSWETSGVVEDVLVATGALVSDGEILATLEELSLPQNVIQASNDLYSAQESLDELYASYDALSLSEAEKAVADAQEARDDAERYYNSLVNGALQSDLYTAEAQVTITRNTLEDAEEEWEQWVNKPEDNLNRAYVQQEYAQAQQNYDDAVRTYNWLTSSATETEMQVATADLALAEEQLQDAQKDYEDLLAGATPEEIQAAEAKVAAAQATLSQAWIEAPFAGIITEIIPQAGDVIASNSEAFRIDDLSQLLVDVEVNELDINLIEVGQRVVLSFDAIRNAEFNGQVVEVGYVGDDSSGVVNFPISIEILDAGEAIKPGMTAEVAIIVTESEEALLVPNQAIRSEDGEQVVYVMQPGTGMQPVAITLGLSSDSHSQVIDGELETGDRIVLNPTDASAALNENPNFRDFSAGGGRPGGGPGGGGGFGGPGGGGGQP